MTLKHTHTRRGSTNHASSDTSRILNHSWSPRCVCGGHFCLWAVSNSSCRCVSALWPLTFQLRRVAKSGDPTFSVLFSLRKDAVLLRPNAKFKNRSEINYIFFFYTQYTLFFKTLNLHATSHLDISVTRQLDESWKDKNESGAELQKHIWFDEVHVDFKGPFLVAVNVFVSLHLPDIIFFHREDHLVRLCFHFCSCKDFYDLPSDWNKFQRDERPAVLKFLLFLWFNFL